MKKLLLILALALTSVTANGESHADVVSQIKKYSPNAYTHVYDPTYTSVSERILGNIIASHYRVIRKYSPKASKNDLFSKDDSFDCDDYAFTFKSTVSGYGLMHGSNYGCGVIIVSQVFDFGGVPAGGYHAINIILIDGVLNVLEPQGYKFTPISEYPNRHHITGLIL